MPQYTIKIITYDPAIVEAYERLRKNRKQAAFTHEALKHFLESETGARVIDLMSRDHSSPSPIAHTVKIVEPSRNAAPSSQVFSPEPCETNAQASWRKSWSKEKELLEEAKSENSKNRKSGGEPG